MRAQLLAAGEPVPVRGHCPANPFALYFLDAPLSNSTGLHRHPHRPVRRARAPIESARCHAKAISWTQGRTGRRATEAFTAAVQASMNPDKAASDAEKIRSKYHGLPIDVIAELLVRRAARK